MSKKYFIPILIAVSTSLLFSNNRYVAADNTSVGVKITDPELYIESVHSPKFGKYIVEKKNRYVTSIEDLKIKIIDKRASKETWQLKYSLSLFEKEDGTFLDEHLKYTILKGTLFKEKQLLPSSEYESKDLKRISNGDSGTLIVNEGKYSSYEYVVKNTDVGLEIPSKTSVGVYNATQTIILESVPNYK